MLGGLIVAPLGLAACSSSAPHAGASSSAGSTTSTSGPPTTAASSTTTASTAPGTTAPHNVVGLVVTGAGNTFAPPASPTVVAYNPNCHALVDAGFNGTCLTITAPSGTIAAIVEQQQHTYQAGQPTPPSEERDLVYHRGGNNWVLSLRRAPVTNQSESRLYESDVNRDGDAKAVFISPAANTQYADELDVVEGTGAVSLYRQLHGGFATIASGGGLETFVPDARQGYDQTVIRYTSGAWRILSDQHVSDAQGQAETPSGGFNDPRGSMAS